MNISDVEFFITWSKPSNVDVQDSSKVNGNDGPLVDEKELKRSHSSSSVDNEDSQSPVGSGSPKPIRRHKNKPAPTPPTSQQQSKNRNPLANVNVKPFSGNYNFVPPSSVGGVDSPCLNSVRPTSEKDYSKEKREGVWIPPSPKETSRRRLEHPPVKPPPPQPSAAETAKQRFLNENSSPLPKPESPLRHKYSFKSGSVDGKGSSSTGTGTSSTTDNISSSTLPTNCANNFASLPRHFQTENSYKKERGPPPARPPSMFGVAPPPPPTISPTPNEEDKETHSAAATVKEGDNPQSIPGSAIGFEKLAAEVRKDSSSSSEEIRSSVAEVEVVMGEIEKSNVKEDGESPHKEKGIIRPIPAPRSSLLQQSNSFKDASSSGGSRRIKNSFIFYTQ